MHRLTTRFTSPRRILLLFLISALLGACATGPTTGVRKDFEQRRVHSVAVASFYAAGTFGMDPQRFQEVRELYEAVATTILQDLGFHVVAPRAFRQHLVELNVWDFYSDGVRLSRPLTTYFELGEANAPTPVEILTLRGLVEENSLPVEALLFGELIYHSEGICRGRAEQSTPYARIHVQAGAPRTLPRPCITSHFQAKLVDLKTGQTMWFNRMFVETHTRHVDRENTRDNILYVVTATIGEDSGLARLAPPPSQTTTHAESQ